MRNQAEARQWRAVVVRASVCLVLGLLSLIAIAPALTILTNYRPPLLPASTNNRPGTPSTDRVVLVVLSGIGIRDLDAPGDPWRFLQLRRRAAEGAFGVARTVEISGDAPTWAALLTGAGPSITGVIDENSPQLRIPTLFDMLRSPDLKSVVVANRAAWRARAGVAPPDRAMLVASSSRAGQMAAGVLDQRSEQLVVILLDAGRVVAGRPAEKWLRLDQQIAVVADRLDARRDTLVVTGDHGILPDGSFGGAEPQVANVPIVLWGRAVLPGALGLIDQRDIAPTISTLLGLEYSPAMEGQALLDALDLPPGRQAQERERLRETRLPVVADNPGGPGSTFWGTSWVWGGVVPMALIFLGWLGARFRHALGKLLLPLACLELYLIAWAMIYFLLADKQLSFSAIYGDWTRNLLNVGLWSVLALGVVGIAIGYACARDGIWMVARHLGNASLLALAVPLLFVGLYLAIIGIPIGRLPDLGGWSVLLIALAQAAGVGLATPVAMLVGALVAEVVARGR